MTERLQETITSHKWAILVSIAFLPIGGLLGLVWSVIVMFSGVRDGDKNTFFRGLTLSSIMVAMTVIAIASTELAASTTQSLIGLGVGMVILWGFLTVLLYRSGNLKSTVAGLSETTNGKTKNPDDMRSQSPLEAELEEEHEAESIEEGQCMECGEYQDFEDATFCRECGGRVR